jgi:hypothetical protein
MRFVHENKEISKKIGKNARKDMIKNYSLKILSDEIYNNLKRIYIKHNN